MTNPPRIGAACVADNSAPDARHHGNRPKISKKNKLINIYSTAVRLVGARENRPDNSKKKQTARNAFKSTIMQMSEIRL